MQSSPGVARGAARRSPTAVLLIVLFAVLAAAALTAAPAASAKKVGQGGLSSRSGLEAEIPESTDEAPVEEVPGTEETTPGPKARLVGGHAIAPASAPAVVKQVIAAANRITATPYIWGGGHRTWVDRGYDCSGAVSFALHGGRLLAGPLTSGSLEAFGEAGAGRWITVYANAAHTYMVVAGLRFDTAGDENGESGPRWHPTVAAAASGTFVVRHPVGY